MPSSTRYLQGLGNLDQALVSTLKSLDNPDNPTALINLGGIYKVGNLDQAIASTLKSLELNPDNPTALINWAYLQRSRAARSSACLHSKLPSQSDNPTAHMKLGGIYKDLGQLDQALASTLKSLQIKPNLPGAIENLKAFIDELNISHPTPKTSHEHMSYYLTRRTYRTESYRKYFYRHFSQ